MLQNKTIVIIGGTAGLGLAAAEACVKSGAKVVVVGRRQENIDAAQNSLGDAGYALQGDATDSTTGYKAIEVAIHKFGSFDGLYHVAGGSGRRMGDGPLHEITDEGWEFTLNLNLTSAFYSNRAAVQQFQIQGNGGSILNMGSVLGSSPSPKYFATHAYAATKAAIEGFTKSCAAYYAKDKIRFNVLAPALFETPMAQRAAENEEIMSFISTKQPLDGGRIGQPEDTAQAAVYFLSGASKFVTGQVLYVDGGWSVSEGQYPPPS
ncbi:MAG: SDR family oxidoreductase [Planctomycetota bacterium]|nr:SDR family oxidoreductase [Planctomycetota bacterium]